MTTEAETVRPEDLKPGDRVRVTVVADGYADETLDVVLDNSYTPFGEWITFPALTHATITRLSPPVDPDLLLARKIVAAQNRAQRLDAWADEVEAGQHDDGGEVAPALAAIKAAKEQS